MSDTQTNIGGLQDPNNICPRLSPSDPEEEIIRYFLSVDQWNDVCTSRQYDLVIIGSGFCCLSLVHKTLKTDPKTRILIIERGSFLYEEHYRNLPPPHDNLLDTTFPWTVSDRTTSGELGTITTQRGIVPFFGGKSTMWNAWCPRPQFDEMQGWPRKTVDAAFHNFEEAERLLQVQKADEIHADAPSGYLQNTVDQRLREAVQTGTVEAIYRAEPAPLSLKSTDVKTNDFQRFSVPSLLLEIVRQQKIKKERGEGEELDIVCDCFVEKILNNDGMATGLKTSRGDLELGDAKLVLALGTIPSTTLVRNSFPHLGIGKRFTSHMKSLIVARTPIYREMLELDAPLQMATTYIAGKSQLGQQFHIQMSSLSNQEPDNYNGGDLKYMPDDVAYASPEDLQTFVGHIVFVCSVVGEMNHDNPNTWIRDNPNDPDITKNSLVQIQSNTRIDEGTWDDMDKAAVDLLDKVLRNKKIEYWIKTPDNKMVWCDREPTKLERRAKGQVHESSTMYLGEDEKAPVGTDYTLRNTQNVYVTGGALWPRGGSWNPTLTMCALAIDLADRLHEERVMSRET